jgi:hypothetical protein
MSVTETFGRFNASDPIGLQPTLFLCPISFHFPSRPEHTNERTKEKRRKTKKKTNDVISYFRHEWLQWM